MNGATFLGHSPYFTAERSSVNTAPYLRAHRLLPGILIHDDNSSNSQRWAFFWRKSPI
jgi:hypothetical protein